MAPFPEVELVTIDRLEVALRKMDFKLLKDGTYKLHEKYHSGHKFEYLDKLEAILVNVLNNPSIPEDIKDILCPTIQDILSQEGIESDTSASPYESLNQNRVSSLTQLSYNTSDKNNNDSATAVMEETSKPEMQSEETKISAFDVFGADKKETRSYTQSPFETEENKPFQEFKMPENTITSPAEPTEPQYNQSEVQTNMFDNGTQTEVQEGILVEEIRQVKDISVFYCQDVSPERTKNILKYRELISKLDSEHYSITEILNLISEINTQSNTNIIELKNILDQLHLSENKVNLITNSSSADLIGLMEQGEYSYSLFEKQEDKKINLIPIFGLSNQFICANCREEYIDMQDKINPLVLQCPRCKSPMFPNFHTAMNDNIQMNLEYYNNALLSLVSSKVWVLIHPVLEDKIMADLILSALKLTDSIEEIYILDKDINIREDFRSRFMAIKENTNINIHMNALEDFLNTIR